MRHDADQVMGRICKDGGWDQRFRRATATDDELEDPGKPENVGWGCVVLAVWGVAFVLYFAIAAVTQVPM